MTAAAAQAESIVDDEYAISRFVSVTNTRPMLQAVLWPALVDNFREPKRGRCTIETCGAGEHEMLVDGESKGCLWKYITAWAPAKFKPGSTRASANVSEMSLLVADADHLTEQELVADREQLSSYRYFAHASHSDRPGDRCVRFVVACSRPVLASEWVRFWGPAMKMLGLRADTKCRNPDRLYFDASRPVNADYFFLENEGEPIDVDAVLALEPETEPKHEPRIYTTATGDDFYIALAGLDQGKVLRDISGTALVGGETIELGKTNSKGHRAIIIDRKSTAGFIDTDGRIGGHGNTRSSAEGPDGGPLVSTWCRYYGHTDVEIRRGLIEHVPELERFAKSKTNASPPRSSTPSAAPSDSVIRAKMFQSEKNIPKPCGSNIELVLRHSGELRGRIRFNEITRTVEANDGLFADEQPNGLDLAIKNWLETHWGLFVDPTAVGKQLLRVARKFGSYDPVKEYLNALAWDQKPRIDGWLVTYCNVPDTGYARKVAARFLISGAARGLDPGCKVDTVLILRGEQGFRKSTTFDILGGEWFSDSPMELDNKDSRITAASRWIVELGELSSIRQSGLESHKAFLAARKDYVRPPYGAVNEEFLRHCVFAGTTNAAEFLIDDTGNRRFWVVTVRSRIDIEALRRDRDQLWAEAVVRYRAGERWWFDDHEQIEADKVAADHEEEDPWADKLASWWDELPKHERARIETVGLELSQIAASQLGIDLEKLKRHERAVGKALRRAGFDRGTVGDSRVRRWFPVARTEHDRAK